MSDKMFHKGIPVTDGSELLFSGSLVITGICGNVATGYVVPVASERIDDETLEALEREAEEPT